MYLEILNVFTQLKVLNILSLFISETVKFRFIRYTRDYNCHLFKIIITLCVNCNNWINTIIGYMCFIFHINDVIHTVSCARFLDSLPESCMKYL